MGLKYTYYDENHNKIGVVTQWTTEEEIQRLKFIYDLDEVKKEE